MMFIMAAKELELALPRYRPSGSTRMTIVPFAVAAVAASALLGVIYSFVASFIPFVMLTFLLVFGVAFGVGAIARITCQYAHCRNRMLGLTLGAVCGLAALGASYWFNYTTGKRELLANVPAAERAVLDKVLTFGEWLEFRKESGWQVKGTQLTGGMVTTIWALEAICVLAFGCALGWQAGNEPYCEQCRAWPKIHSLSIKGHTGEEFVASARAGTPLAALQFPKSDRADVSLKFENHICQSCGNGFLDVEEEVVTLKEGKEQTTKKPIIKSVLLDKPSCDQYLAARQAWLAS